ncbi:hypothetical protein Tco_0789769, partial [Tanacetum coccineum]
MDEFNWIPRGPPEIKKGVLNNNEQASCFDFYNINKKMPSSDIHEGGDESVLSTQEYIWKVIEDVGEDEDFKGESWVRAVEFVNANGGIVNGCLGDMKDYLKNEKLE